MTSDQTEPRETQRLRPLWRPFVGRPVLLAAIPAGLILAATYFFRQPLRSILGDYLFAGPAVAILLLVVTLAARCIRYAKTRYEIRPDRIIVETGTLFRERTVELDVENITLVEWNSPFLLRTLYDVGHLTIQEAGSAEQPAQLNYVVDAGRLYERIGEHMSARGFSMRRTRRIQEETPGHLGALVDISAEHIQMFWAVGLVLLTALPELLPLIVGDGPSLTQLLAGNYEVFSDVLAREGFFRARAGAILVGGTVGLLVGTWLTMRYLDLLYRTYTLYDDVIDYVDGFVNETHKFIPLENLADTQLSRPFYKRILGLSDVTLSSQGAENAIAFRSTPDGPSFAEAIDDLVRRGPDRPDVTAEPGRPDATADADRSDATPSPAGTEEATARTFAREFEPDRIRAILRSFEGSFTAIPFAIVLPLSVLLSDPGETIAIGPLAFATLAGALLATVGLAAAFGVASGIWGLVQVHATDFRFDERGAHRAFDLFSREEKQFALERITSISVLRNPLDWIAGTMTVRFRSIGSDEDIDFWGIDHDPAIVQGIRRQLGLVDVPSGDPSGELTPEYTWLDGLTSCGPLYFLVGGIAAIPILILALLAFPTGGLAPALIVAAVLAGVASHQMYRAVVHGRIRGALFEDHLDIAGGIIRHYRHIAPLEHVKAVKSRRYPGSDAGGLTFKTAGFPLATDHLPEVADRHRHVDETLAGIDGTAPPDSTDSPSSSTTFRPSVGTEALRRVPLLSVGIGLVVVPYVVLYYRKVNYTVEPGRLVADSGLYFDCRTTVLFGRVDHIESNRKLAQYLTGTHNIQVYTVGSRECDLVIRSLSQSNGALERIRERLAFDDASPKAEPVGQHGS